MPNDINLIPEKETDYQKTFKIVLIIFFVLGLLICGSGTGLIYFYNQGLKEKISQQDQRIQQTEAGINLKISQEDEKQAKKFQKQTQYLKEILDQHVFSLKALENILSLILPDVSFENFAMNYEEGKVSMDLSGPSYKIIAEQIKKIKDSSLTNKVEFGDVSFGTIETQAENQEETAGQVKVQTSLEIILNKVAWGVEKGEVENGNME